ncbi:MAG TPA: hypothetical protein PKM17_12175 [Syntrophorhabdus sp.]|nr:hypothetical protein [Syntrophorhabdus sp.]
MKEKREKKTRSVTEVLQISKIIREMVGEVNRRKERDSEEGLLPKTEGSPLDNLRAFLDNATVKNWKR